MDRGIFKFFARQQPSTTASVAGRSEEDSTDTAATTSSPEDPAVNAAAPDEEAEEGEGCTLPEKKKQKLTEIERLKNEKPTWERRVRWDGMKAVFGGPPSLLWFNPFAGLRLRRLLMIHARKGGSEFAV